MISVDELRTAGALEVPPARRKSIGRKRELLSGSLWDEDSPREHEHSSPGDPEENESTDDPP